MQRHLTWIVACVLSGCAGTAAYQRACDEGSGEACRQLGSAYERGSGAAKDPGRAFQLYDKACTAGDAEACERALRGYQCGDGVPRNTGKAPDFAKRLCTLDPQRCFLPDASVAKKLTYDAMVKPSEALCLEGDLGACGVLAELLVHGHGSLSDPKGTYARLSDACDANVADACASVAAMSVQGLGTPTDLARGELLLARACALNNGSYCPIASDAPPPLPEALTHEQLAAGNGARASDVLGCLRLQRLCEPGLGGRASIKVSIAANGSVSAASMRDTTVRSRGFAECALGRARQWKFPAPTTGEQVDVVLPFILLDEVR